MTKLIIKLLRLVKVERTKLWLIKVPTIIIYVVYFKKMELKLSNKLILSSTLKLVKIRFNKRA